MHQNTPNLNNWGVQIVIANINYNLSTKFSNAN